MDIYDDFEKYLGFIEKKIRLKNELSLENVSKDLKIAKGYLSDAENGKRILKESTFRSILDFYGINFNFDPSLLENARILLNDLMESYIYKNIKKEKRILETVAGKLASYENSLACLYSLLLTMMSARMKNPASLSKKDKDAFCTIDDYLPVFENDEKALIFYLKAFQARLGQDFDLSLTAYSQALDSFDGKLWPQLEGIIKLNYAQSRMIETSYYEGYQTVQEAHDIFIKHGNYARALMCYNNMANYLLCFQSYSAAKAHCQKVLLSAGSFTGVLLYRQAVTTMLIILTLEESFQEAIQFADEHPTDTSDGFVGNLILIPYCYYRLGQMDQCLEEMQKFDPEILESDNKAFFALLKAILQEDPFKIEAAKQKMLRICCRQKNWLMLMVLYQLLIDYYKSANELELLVDAYEENGKVLRHFLPLEK